MDPTTKSTKSSSSKPKPSSSEPKPTSDSYSVVSRPNPDSMVSGSKQERKNTARTKSGQKNYSDVPHSSSHELPSISKDLLSVRSLWVDCSSELQLSHDASIILDALYATNYKELEPAATTSQESDMTTSTSQVSEHSLKSLLFQIGMNCKITNYLKETILFLQNLEVEMSGLEVEMSGGPLLPGDSYPDWLTFSSKGSSVTFEVPQVKGSNLKTMMCIVYTSTPDNIMSSSLKNVLVKNYTKATIQLYKSEALVSFEDEDEDEDGQRVVSSIEPGNKVEVVFVFENNFIVKKTVVYLVYDEQIGVKREECQVPEENVIVCSGDENECIVRESSQQVELMKENDEASEPKSDPVLDLVISDSKPDLEPAPDPESEITLESLRIHDVFLSFRGKDTRSAFTSHLYAALKNHGIKVFRDDNELQRGDYISTSISRAIEQSRISIIVFSKNYADSRWCLNELEKIIMCRRTIGQVVVPVFYHVDPSEVRNQRGEFGRAFDSLVNTILNEVKLVLSWKVALGVAGGLAGCVVLNFRNENEAINDIVENVIRLLDKTYLFVADYPVGLESRVRDVIQLLDIQRSNDALLLGIWGMGGIGKTTLAKAIYNEIGRNFEGRSFLANIREVWDHNNGPISLQKQILFDICRKRKTKIQNIESGKILLKDILFHKRVLLVLDDVNTFDQLNDLCGSSKWLGPGSRIIITTRDMKILRDDLVYKMKEMDESESIELFSWHAFKKVSPREDFAEISRNVVEYSGGLPLAMEVLGSYLIDRGIVEWRCVLEKLKIIPNDQVQKKLRISYDVLNDDTIKEIFLDIACFFIGMDRNDVIQILNGCGLFAEIGISVLVERSLVTVDDKNKLGMHDLVRAMGREIIREKSPKEPEKRSRLWRKDDVLDVLLEQTGTEVVEGLVLKLQNSDANHFSTKAFEKMNRLRLLQLADVKLDGLDVDFDYLSRKLRWLCWNGFALSCIPTKLYRRNLVSMELENSKVELVWKENQRMEKLNILNLSHSHYLTQTPNFSYLPNLEKLVLVNCPRLYEISHSIGDLKKILLINLENCVSLRSLPRSIYKLKSLETLNISGCLMIDKLEDEFEQLESLTTLLAKNTAITRVPFSIVRSKSIGYISLCGYEGFSDDVFPSIILSWMSPRNNLPSNFQTSTTNTIVHRFC